MRFEIVFLSVLQNEQTVFLQQVMFENQVGNGSQPLEFIGRVGKMKSNCPRPPAMYLNTSPRIGMHLSVLTSFMILQMKA